MVYVEKYFSKSIPAGSITIDTTSRSSNWSQGLSPFILEGGHLYGNYIAKNIENAWQGSKVYPKFVDEWGDPSPEYFKWAAHIWMSSYAHRYTMGKGAVPEYSYWEGQKLSYTEARKKIYIPLYSRAVKNSEAFKKLSDLYLSEKRDIYLIDFDGYNHVKMGKSIEEVINDPHMKMGHAFVLWKVLTEEFGLKNTDKETALF